MPISFDSALGIHEKAIGIWSRRAEMLASNIANTDTPGYKAKDIDFKAALASLQSQSADSLTRSSPKHIQTSVAGSQAELLYRVPNQASVDGNTVDPQVEKAAFAENALRYQASLQFISGKFKGMLAAIKGE